MHHEPVLLDLNAIVQQPGAKGSFNYSLRLPPEEEPTCEGPVEIALQIQNTGHALLVRGNLRAYVRASCARCLEETVIEVNGEIEEQFSLPGQKDENLELIDQVEPREAAFADQILNVSELARQRILLLLPLRVLCKPDCKGLCPSCGQNLNTKNCGCPMPAAHPVWEALRGLKDDRKE